MDLSRDKVSGRVRSLIGRKLGLATEDVGPEASFRELGLDSMEAFQMVFLFEDEFGLQVDDDLAMNVHSVPTLVDALWEMLSQE